MGGWIDQVENNVKYIRLLLEETKVWIMQKAL